MSSSNIDRPFSQHIELSIIVPMLNEAGELPELFSSLEKQSNICFELILCDGGSNDNSVAISNRYAGNKNFPVRVIHTDKGRGIQMNAGAAIATAPLLLFIHADSRFTDNNALAVAVAYYRQKTPLTTVKNAARFCLRFRRTTDKASLAYFYYEQKARLNRSDCIRGDQGLLVTTGFFIELGGFDTSLPFLEDIHLARQVCTKGKWLLLPADICTSARRFEIEGMYERQALNAIISCSHAIGWKSFFVLFRSIYRSHGESGKIDLAGTLTGIRNLITSESKAWRHIFWRNVGGYVAGNAWQFFFWLDVRQQYYNSHDSDKNGGWLSWYERHVLQLFHSQPAKIIAMALTWSWLQLEILRAYFLKSGWRSQ